MKPTFWQRLDLLARSLTPVALTFALVIVNVVPLHVPGFARILPLLPLISVFHWSLHRPHLMPAYAVFAIGLFQDGLTGAPFGLNALILLAVHGIVLVQHRFFLGKSFFVHWFGFAMVGLAASVLGWIIVSAFHVTLMPVRPVAYQLVMTLAVFPVLAWVFFRWQRTFLREE